MAQVCIMCAKETAGERVEDTPAIQFIRAIKKKLNMASNNILVVCPDCMPLHAKRRKSFEHTIILYGVIGAVLILVSIVIPLLGGNGLHLGSMFMAILLSLFLVGLSFLSYVPPLEKNKKEQAEKKPDLLDKIVAHADKKGLGLSGSQGAKSGAEKKGLGFAGSAHQDDKKSLGLFGAKIHEKKGLAEAGGRKKARK